MLQKHYLGAIHHLINNVWKQTLQDAILFLRRHDFDFSTMHSSESYTLCDGDDSEVNKRNTSAKRYQKRKKEWKEEEDEEENEEEGNPNELEWQWAFQHVRSWVLSSQPGTKQNPCC